MGLHFAHELYVIAIDNKYLWKITKFIVKVKLHYFEYDVESLESDFVLVLSAY